MTETPLGLQEPTIRRLQQAFAHEEPTTELAAVLQRAAGARGLTSYDLAADRLGGDRVMAVLGRLPPDQREVLVLRILGGLTAPEVAAALGKTTGAVKALQHRGLASLARVLGLRSTEELLGDPGLPQPGRGPSGGGGGSAGR